MQRFQWAFLWLALLGVGSIVAYGVAVAERSLLIAILATITLYLSFKIASVQRKKKGIIQEEG